MLFFGTKIFGQRKKVNIIARIIFQILMNLFGDKINYWTQLDMMN